MDTCKGTRKPRSHAIGTSNWIIRTRGGRKGSRLSERRQSLRSSQKIPGWASGNAAPSQSTPPDRWHPHHQDHPAASAKVEPGPQTSVPAGRGRGKGCKTSRGKGRGRLASEHLPGAHAADLTMSPPTSIAAAPLVPSRNNGSSSSSSSSSTSSVG